MTDTTLLADVEAEAGLLGSLLIDGEALAAIAPTLKPDDFTDPFNARVYGAMLALEDAGREVNYVTVMAALPASGPVTAMTNAELTALINQSHSSLYAADYAERVRSLAEKRRLLAAGEEIGRRAQAGGLDPQGAEELLARVTAGRTTTRDLVTLREAVEAYLTTFTERQQATATAAVAGVPTGFADLDRTLGGLKPGELVILAARPSVGKSALAFNVARNVAGTGVGVVVFSLEMSVASIAERLLSAEARVDSGRLRGGYIDQNEWARVGTAFGVLTELPVWVDETAAPTLAEIRGKARRLKAQHPSLGLVVVDYLQLVAPSQTRGQSREQAVAEVSRGLKALARELHLPVLALSQLSRGVEQREDKRPMLSDLRESGAIEQDADVVLFLHREDRVNPNTDRRNIADLIVGKNRAGALATIPLRWFPQHVLFTDLEVYRAGENAA